MIGNTQAPDKGLLDVLFGKKPEAAQAGEASQAAGDSAQQLPEDFMKALAEAQDQGEKAKGEIKQEAAKKKAEAQKAEALKKAAAKAGTGKAADAKADGKTKQASKEEAQAQAQAQAQALAAAMAKAQTQTQSQSQPQPQSEHQAQLKAAAKPVVQWQANVKPQPQTQTQTQTKTQSQTRTEALAQSQSGQLAAEAKLAEMLAKAQEAAVTSQNAAIASQEAALASMKHGQAQPGQATLQPIVIQMPMAMPVEVLDVDAAETDLAPGGPDKSRAFGQALSSQDFIAMGAAGRGLARAVGEKGSADGNLPEQSRHESSNGEADRFGMMLPQVGHQGSAGFHATMTPLSSGDVRVAVNASGNVEVANTAALGREVAKLAANGGGAIRMKVMPESLGEVTIHVTTSQDQRLNVRFEAQSHEAREALAGSVPELRQMLSASRFDVGAISVDHAASGAAIRASGDALGMSSWSNFQSSMDWQGSRDSQGWQGGQQQGGSAWDRYFDQRDARDERRQGGYRRYQQEYELGA